MSVFPSQLYLNYCTRCGKETTQHFYFSRVGTCMACHSDNVPNGKRPAPVEVARSSPAGTR